MKIYLHTGDNANLIDLLVEHGSLTELVLSAKQRGISQPLDVVVDDNRSSNESIIYNVEAEKTRKLKTRG